MKKLKVAVGLSGGVDSAVSAYLLKKQGFDVSGVYLHCFDDDAPGCRGKQDRQDALSVALHLKIPFQVLDFRRQYKSSVIAYFKKEYLAGRTPNPDVVCNRDIKFGLLLDWCIKNGFDYLATGHYARLVTLADSRNSRTTAKYANPLAFAIFAKFRDFREKKVDTQSKLEQISDEVLLAQPQDLHKDQTYFLWAVPRQNFSRVLFPLADFRKNQVRSVAKFAKIPIAAKPDSTGICFIGEVRVEDFLKRLGVREKAGDVVMRTTIDDSGKLDDRRLKIEDSGGRSKMEDRKAGIDKSTFNPLFSTTTFHLPSSTVSASFKVIGSHRGVWFYTIGQRHGFSTDLWSSKNNSEFRMKNAEWEKQADPKHSEFRIHHSKLVPDRPPLYVIAKDLRRNRLIVGFGPETYRDNFEVSDCNWLVDHGPWIIDHRQETGRRPSSKVYRLSSIYVRIRHLGDLIPCSVISSQSSVISYKSISYQSAGSRQINRQPTNHKQKTENRKQITVFLSQPQRGVAPGQSAVFYSKDGLVLGGGVIQ